MEAIILERIAELLRYRSWWRVNRWADWPEIRVAHEIELRALVRLTRQYRHLEAAKPDPITLALAEQDRSYPVGVSYHDYQIAGPR